MSITKFKSVCHAACAMSVLLGAVLLTACVANAPQQIERPVAISDDALLEQGILFAVDDLLAQALKTPGFQPLPKSAMEQLLKNTATRPSKSLVVIDNTVEGVAGQQTAATRLVDRRILELLQSRLETHDVTAVSAGNVKAANYLVTSTLTQAQSGTGTSGF